MKITIEIDNCQGCKHLDHTGAFTPNGALAQCHHPKADKNFCMKDHTGRDKDKNWNIAKAGFTEIPEKCPLRKGHGY